MLAPLAPCGHVAVLHSYPTDLKLLDDAREKTERIIDDLHAAIPGSTKKPRTYHRTVTWPFMSMGSSQSRRAVRCWKSRRISILTL